MATTEQQETPCFPLQQDESVILWDVARERSRQWRKFASREGELSREKLLAILTEEFLEVARAVNDHQPWEQLRDELIQTAAVCVKFVSIQDRVEEQARARQEMLYRHLREQARQIRKGHVE